MPLYKKSSIKAKLKSQTSFVSPLLTTNNIISSLDNDYKPSFPSKTKKIVDDFNDKSVQNECTELQNNFSRASSIKSSSLFDTSEEEEEQANSLVITTKVKLDATTDRDRYTDTPSSQLSELLDNCVKANLKLSQEISLPLNRPKNNNLQKTIKPNLIVENFMSPADESDDIISSSNKSENYSLKDALDDIVNLNKVLSQSQSNDIKFFERKQAKANIKNGKTIRKEGGKTKKDTKEIKHNGKSEQTANKTRKRKNDLKRDKDNEKFDSKKNNEKKPMKKRKIDESKDQNNKDTENNKKHEKSNSIGEKQAKKKHGLGQLTKMISISTDTKTIEADIDVLLKLQKLRDVGLYVYCDKCDKVRYLPDCKDPLELPNMWYCHMNPNPKYNKCSDPEWYIDPETDDQLIHNKYNAGSIVWAKMDGFPWWPAMVDDDPDLKEYFWLDDEETKVPSWYHVTFFDSKDVTRAWIKTHNLEPFLVNVKNKAFKPKNFDFYKHRLDVAVREATKASNLSILERLNQYGFVQRYFAGRNLKQMDKKNKIKGEKKKLKLKNLGKEKSGKNIQGDDEQDELGRLVGHTML